MNRIIILVIFLSFTTSLQAQSVESDELFSKGVELYNLKRYNEAISYFNKSNNIDKALFVLSFFCCFYPATDAPYPPETTAFIISSTLTSVSSKSTCILFCNKFTFTDFTPLSFLTLFSTCALHALHVIPVTLNFSVTLSPSRIF